MQVGGVSHGFGTSRLWHDPNYEVNRDYRPIPVQRGITSEDALPHEEHVAPPEKRADPYKVQEQAYDVAHTQAVRGEEAKKLLHGATNAAAFDAAVQARREAEVVRNGMAGRDPMTAQAIQPGMPTGNVRPQETTPFAPGQVSQPQGSAGSSQDKDAARAARDAQDSSEIVDAVALGGGSVLAVGGMLKATAAVQGAQAATAVAGAGAAGVSVAGTAQARDPSDATDISGRGRQG